MTKAIVWVGLVVLVAGVGIVANFRLLRLTQDARDPVGRLSPRAVFIGSSSITTPTSPGTGTVPDPDDGSSRGRDSDD